MTPKLRPKDIPSDTERGILLEKDREAREALKIFSIAPLAKSF